MDDWKEFAEVARAARDGLGWKRGELQRRTGIPPSTLSHIMAGGAPSYRNLVTLMKVLGIRFVHVRLASDPMVREPESAYGVIEEGLERILAELRRERRSR